MSGARRNCLISIVLWTITASGGVGATGHVATNTAAAAALSVGERIYREGVLPRGAPLRGVRDNGISLGGAAAACVNCHRRSGLGSYEGTTIVPPVIGRYLFRTRLTNIQDLNLPHVRGFTPNRDAYTDTTLALALRTGVAPGGRTLSDLMPRYALDAGAMKALLDYLKHLGTDPVPGVSDTDLEFATIVTPDADPVAAEAMLSVMQRFFGVQNEVIAGEVRPLKSNRDIMYRVTRRWHLHVWRLQGAAESWPQQLSAHLAAEPVFAIISGIGGRNWQPVHSFCERQALPCLLPNIDLPVVAEQDFYSVYWSRGVLLEADLIGQALVDKSGSPAPVGRIVQLFRSDDIGVAAAAALRRRFATGGPTIVDEVISGDLPELSSKAFERLQAGDRLVVWLRNDDLKILPVDLPTGVDVYASGLMAGLDGATPPTKWRSRVHFAYPFDLPDLRRVRMNFPLGWMRVQKLAVVNERVQTDTYIACQILAEGLGHMLDSFVRDFLVERLEMMLSTRLVSGYYPRLGLGPGQRFASKGGYLVHFSEPAGTKVIPDGDWTVP